MPTPCACVATGKTVRAETILIATGAAPHLGADIAGHRARHLVERSVPPASASEARPDPGRRLHRRRVRQHLPRPRLRGDAGLSRRADPARLRQRRARASRDRNGQARHQDRVQADRRCDREGRARPRRRVVRPRILHGRLRDVRHRPQAERAGPRAGEGRRDARERRDRGRRVLAHLGAEHLCGRRRDRPDQPHPGRDPRGSRVCRHRVRRQADEGRSRRRSDRGVLRAGGGRHRPDRDAGRRTLSAHRRLQDARSGR